MHVLTEKYADLETLPGLEKIKYQSRVVKTKSEQENVERILYEQEQILAVKKSKLQQAAYLVRNANIEHDS